MSKKIDSAGDSPLKAVRLLRIGCMDNAAAILRKWREVLRFACSREARGRQDFSGVSGNYLLACGEQEGRDALRIRLPGEKPRGSCIAGALQPGPKERLSFSRGMGNIYRRWNGRE